MSLGIEIAWDDAILPFQLDGSDTRGRFVRLNRTVNEVLAQHDYPPAIEALVAEATLLTALIGQAIDLRWKLSLQIRGDGALRLLATDYYAPSEAGQPARIRAYANFDATDIEKAVAPFDLVGDGYFGVLIDQGAGTEPYQGITPIAGGSLAACAETYFAQSEQLPTRFALTYSHEPKLRAGGIMIQNMPKASPFAASASASLGGDGLLKAESFLEGDDKENWSRVNILLDTVRDDELLGPDVEPTEVLVRLFHEETPRIFDAQQVSFGCTCSEERLKDSLARYAADDISDLVTEEGKIEADCQFCGARYVFTPEELLA